MSTIRERLFELQDKQYAEFQSNLTPTLPRERFIGVRTPGLRALAKEMLNYNDATGEGVSDEVFDFMKKLPHYYFEENQLHAFLIAEEKKFSVCLEQLELFLPYIDNWATCDQLSPKVFKRNSVLLLPYIERWMDSSHIYTVRFGIGMLMRYYLDDAFDVTYAEQVAAIPADRPYFSCINQPGASDAGQPVEMQPAKRAEEPIEAAMKVSASSDKPYYISMMIAWYFAAALAKQYDRVLPFIENKRLDPWTHNKAIQKAVESCRVTPEHKAYLRTLKVASEKTSQKTSEIISEKTSGCKEKILDSRAFSVYDSRR